MFFSIALQWDNIFPLLHYYILCLLRSADTLIVADVLPQQQQIGPVIQSLCRVMITLARFLPGKNSNMTLH